jgi:hypothetical protein
LAQDSTALASSPSPGDSGETEHRGDAMATSGESS